MIALRPQDQHVWDPRPRPRPMWDRDRDQRLLRKSQIFCIKT